MFPKNMRIKFTKCPSILNRKQDETSVKEELRDKFKTG